MKRLVERLHPVAAFVSWLTYVRSGSTIQSRTKGVSTSTSRWLMIARSSWWRYSMGFSTVMMCAARVWLRWSTSEASVVLLPLPVVPVRRMPGNAVGEIHLVLARQVRLERRRHQLGCQRVHCGRIETAVLDNRT